MSPPQRQLHLHYTKSIHYITTTTLLNYNYSCTPPLHPADVGPKKTFPTNIPPKKTPTTSCKVHQWIRSACSIHYNQPSLQRFPMFETSASPPSAVLVVWIQPFRATTPDAQALQMPRLRKHPIFVGLKPTLRTKTRRSVDHGTDVYIDFINLQSSCHSWAWLAQSRRRDKGGSDAQPCWWVPASDGDADGDVEQGKRTTRSGTVTALSFEQPPIATTPCCLAHRWLGQSHAKNERTHFIPKRSDRNWIIIDFIHIDIKFHEFSYRILIGWSIHTCHNLFWYLNKQFLMRIKQHVIPQFVGLKMKQIDKKHAWNMSASDIQWTCSTFRWCLRM